MKNLITHEIQHFMFGLRFPIALVIVLVMFASSSFIYIGEYKEVNKKYLEQMSNQETQLRTLAASTTNVAIRTRSYQLQPRGSGFISDCGEMNIPNTLTYNAYYRIGFDTGGATSDNPYIMPSSRINWGFVMLTLFSFLAIIFSFDAITGEKEQRTLALCLSNPVKRGHILASKFIAINALLITFAIVGMLLALVILALSPAVRLTSDSFLEIGLFLLFVVFFTGSMSAIGMFASVMSRNSNISLLLSVSLWLLFLIAIPNFARTLGMLLYPVEKGNVMQTKIMEKYKEIEAGFPDGKWTSNGNNPFLPQHEIRANMQMAFAKNEADHIAERRDELFHQLEKIRLWTYVSPLAVFEYGTEALLDGGYLRLRKNFTDMQNFKIQYLQWFKDIDAKDDQSPHWYNPNEIFSTTKKPVAYEEIPQFAERSTTIAERLAETMKYLAIMLGYMGVMFLVTVIRFNRYDPR
jgi:ABC-type transport system involved in multi-copper enzyme maturation permease subunit